MSKIKENDLNLERYFQVMEFVNTQETRLENQLYTKIAQINKSLFKNQVCVYVF